MGPHGPGMAGLTEGEAEMVKTYGIRATGSHPERPGMIYKRAEITAGSAAEAQGYMRGWCIVKGCDPSTIVTTVETDGMTYREHMTRELRDAGARMSLRHGAEVLGPWEREPAYAGDEPRSIMRLILSNGWGVSLASRLSDTFSADTSLVTGYPVDGDDWTCEFPPGVLAYETRVMIANDAKCDAEIGDILAGLAKLPRR